MLKNCLICKNEFKTILAHTKIGWGKYCSRNCWAEDHKRGDYKKCLFCSKEFYSSRGEQKRGGGKFCSYKCSVGFKGKNGVWNKGIKRPEFSGEKHPNWRGGITPINKAIRTSLEYKLWRTAVFERDNYTCVWCKKETEMVLL